MEAILNKTQQGTINEYDRFELESESDNRDTDNDGSTPFVGDSLTLPKVVQLYSIVARKQSDENFRFLNFRSEIALVEAKSLKLLDSENVTKNPFA